jgi:hypothetical protein
LSAGAPPALQAGLGGAEAGAIHAEALVDAVLDPLERAGAVLAVAQQGFVEGGRAARPGGFQLRQLFSAVHAGDIEVAQRIGGLAIGQRNLAQQRRDARRHPRQVADAALVAVLVRQRIQAIPPALAQAGHQQQAVGQAAQAAGLGLGFGQPHRELQVLAALFDQLGALPSHELPVGFLQFRDPGALLQRGVVGLAGAHDGVDLAGEDQVLAAGALGIHRRQQTFQVQHGALLMPARPRT